jgi:Uma2 family endonuclease
MTAPVLVEKVHVPIVLGDHIQIPGWVVDLQTFRRWARSHEYPDHGWFSFLDGKLWADLSMEQLSSHSQVKTKCTMVLGGLVDEDDLGYFFSDRTLFTNSAAGLSTEPDGLFASWDAVRHGRVRIVAGAQEGVVEVEGIPDIVLEIVSRNSVHKDTKVLHDLYWRAGITEYWLVDGRKEKPRFDIYRHTPKGYEPTRRQAGWLKSTVFRRAFRLSQQKDRLGHPKYTLAVR